jgi:hypothetical protein
MLFLLAGQALRCDRGHASSAWVDDHDLSVGLWGSRGPRLPASRINTVILRTREQLRKAGLSPLLLQKEAGRTRLGLAATDIVIEAPASPPPSS